MKRNTFWALSNWNVLRNRHEALQKLAIFFQHTKDEFVDDAEAEGETPTKYIKFFIYFFFFGRNIFYLKSCLIAGIDSFVFVPFYVQLKVLKLQVSLWIFLFLIELKHKGKELINTNFFFAQL